MCGGGCDDEHTHTHTQAQTRGERVGDSRYWCRPQPAALTRLSDGVGNLLPGGVAQLVVFVRLGRAGVQHLVLSHFFDEQLVGGTRCSQRRNHLLSVSLMCVCVKKKCEKRFLCCALGLRRWNAPVGAELSKSTNCQAAGDALRTPPPPSLSPPLRFRRPGQ